jgi:hypothetical protein
MLLLPKDFLPIFFAFSTQFTVPTLRNLLTLFVGAILCRGPRRVSTILRVMGLGQEKRFEKFHRVLNRAKWSGSKCSEILLGLVISRLPKGYPIKIAVDETHEWRSGKTIKSISAFRDSVRSSKTKVVHSFGLRWVCFTLLFPVPWNKKRCWALPFLTVLARSEAANERLGKTHVTSIELTILSIQKISGWLKRRWILVGDGAYATMKLAFQCAENNVTLVSRLRLDASLYDTPKPRIPGQKGRPCVRCEKQKSLHERALDESLDWKTEVVEWYNGKKRILKILTGVSVWYRAGKPINHIRWVLVKDPNDKRGAQAFFSTDLNLSSKEIIELYVERWSIEVTFQESRAHLGIQTQRHWCEKAIERTTPMIYALFSLVTLMGLEINKSRKLKPLLTSWYYKKKDASFSDVLTLVRRSIWGFRYFSHTLENEGTVEKGGEKYWELIEQLSAGD